MPIVFLFARTTGGHYLLSDGDTGWHVRTGEWMLQSGGVPVKDIFSFTKPGEPWFAWEWGWDLAFGWLHQHGGMAAVLLASLLVLCTTFALLYRLVRRNCPNVLVAFGVTVLAIAGSAMHWLARPHLFTLLFVVLFLSILERARGGRTRLLLWLPALMVLWTNLHGGFFVGVFLVGCYAAGELALWLVEKDRVAAGAALTRSKPYVATVAACAAATLVNPYFYRLHLHIWNFLNTPALFQHIIEFKPPDFQSPLAFWFEPMVLLGALAIAWSVSQRHFAHALLVAVWVHLALLSVRNLPIYLIVAAPAVAGMLHAALTRLAGASLAGWLSTRVRRFLEFSDEFAVTDRAGRVYLTSVLVFAAVSAGFYLPAPPPKFRAEYDPKRYPAKAVELLRGPEFARSIFTPDDWGDYLVYRLHPQTKVFVDGRSDFYGAQFNGKYMDLINAKHGWEDTLRKYGVDTVLMPVDAPLTGVLKECSRWRPIYDDGVAMVFRSEAALARDRTAGGPQASARRADEAGGRIQSDREITNFKQPRDPRITNSNTRSGST